MRAPIATAVFVFSAMTGVFVACTFPSPTLVDVTDSSITQDSTLPGNDSSSTPDGSTTADVSEDVRSDVFYTGDSSFIFIDGGADAEGGFYNCDKDGDKVFASGAPCGGLDCNDNNKDVYPDENRPYSTLPPLGGSPPGNGGDWDCNGQVDKQYKTKIECGGLTNGFCTITMGFTGDPACGTAGEFITCAKNNLGFCVVTSTIQQTQGCK